MTDLARCPNALNRKTRECKAIIETPKGRRSKFDYDPKYNLFALGGLLPEGMNFPFDFGFIPSTMASDGDPLDVMVLMDEPAHVGCLLDVRLIGVIEADQTTDKKTIRNDRLLAVSVHSYSHENVHSLEELHPSIVTQIEEFFVSYNKQRGKKFQVRGKHGPKRAIELVKESIARHQKKR